MAGFKRLGEGNDREATVFSIFPLGIFIILSDGITLVSGAIVVCDLDTHTLTNAFFKTATAVQPMGETRIYMHLRNRILISALAVLALLIIALGSIVEIGALLGIGTNEVYAGAQNDVVSYTAVFVWIPALFVSWLMLSGALVLAQRGQTIISLFVAWLVAGLVSSTSIFAVGGKVPVRGTVALFFILLFVVINGGAFYAAWPLLRSRNGT